MKLSNIIFKGVLPVTVLSASVLAFAALTSQPPEVEAIQDEKVFTVETLTVNYQAQQPQLELYGLVQTPHQQIITSEVNGKLLSVLVSSGEQVAAGDLLMEIDNFHAQQAVANQALQISQIDSQILQNRQQLAQNEQELTVQVRLLTLAQNQLSAADSMLRRELISDTEHAAQVREAANLELAIKRLEGSIELADIQLKQLQLQKQVAQNELANLERALAQTSIVAPVSGQIVGNLPVPGQFISTGMQLSQIVQTNLKEVQIQLPTELSRLLEGENVTALTDSGAVLSLDRINASVQPGMVGRTAYLQVSENNHQLTSGDTIKLSLNLPSIDSAMAVPVNAIFDDKRVYEIVEGKLEAVEFEHLGSMVNEGERYILIRANELTNGEQLLSTRIANVTSGMQVQEASDD